MFLLTYLYNDWDGWKGDRLQFLITCHPVKLSFYICSNGVITIVGRGAPPPQPSHNNLCSHTRQLALNRSNSSGNSTCKKTTAKYIRPKKKHYVSESIIVYILINFQEIASQAGIGLHNPVAMEQ